MHIRIGTRGSKLALWQANYVADLLQKGGATTELVMVETKGDKILNKALSKIGSKGVFTEELEEHLRQKEVDIAVHSAKDVQSTLPDDLELIAFSEREEVHDVLISFNTDARLDTFNSSYIIGTSSTRRVAQLKHYYPKIRTADVRGNLQTRMKKLEKGNYDALILAYAGVHRMGFSKYIVEDLSPNKFIPAVGQGCVAIEAAKDLNNDKVAMIRQCVNDKKTEQCLRAERSFLKTLEGGCSIPVFGLARIKKNQIELKGGIISLNGQDLVKQQAKGVLDDGVSIGKQLAERILQDGGEEILSEIKANL
ncbi:hydroxymethylbilane synthase [Microscilla marina]|uniref:Porphobilinogen deaminase n=1 Tax=Microscilla marina ATCC 23134 TaxID=313606 RepID=A1ZNC8_MICM2|nr:hydroxymethylbilane synthase [Microscilla marina]EAY28039.1 porphobilinogen deaminase [Microscilla marina ATCC 23134]